MDAKELQKLLDGADLSQRGAAKLIGIDERTMRYFCSGDRPIPRTVELAVRYLARHKREVMQEME